MWTQEQLRDLTMEKVVEEHLALFQIKQHYERQDVDPQAELLADLELLNEENKSQFELIKIILNCIHWWIRGGTASMCSPNRINFFCFHIHFHQKVYASEVSAPPMGNPGSTTGITAKFMAPIASSMT